MPKPTHWENRLNDSTFPGVEQDDSNATSHGDPDGVQGGRQRQPVGVEVSAGGGFGDGSAAGLVEREKREEFLLNAARGA
ncbi:hypothetical protein [Streptomyces sp. PSAA01]|uniref:hypothetical protein n=1 Tax=Streptomyces sp. PSAA01 TaxID=2912762 RepID=UPI001F3B5BF2|nr:hypothetical protein [Streptomyces sp. PSAA01]MCG0284836.1 hypothetical protein [Streptomyces sp. PSAA01]